MKLILILRYVLNPHCHSQTNFLEFTIAIVITDCIHHGYLTVVPFLLSFGNYLKCVCNAGPCNF